MRIYIVRHGEAELATLGASDAERQLTAKGQRQAARVGTALRVLGGIPAVVLTSPLPRARQTAELAVEGDGRQASTAADTFSTAWPPAHTRATCWPRSRRIRRP